MAAPILEVKDLKVNFRTDRGEVQAVRGVSFALEAGEVLGIVGESGCGKTVTTLSLMGLIASAGDIVGGEILYNGKDLRSISAKEWRHIRGNEIAMIFQDPMTSLNPFMTIGEQVLEMVNLHTDLRPRDAKKRVIEVLESVGLDSASKRFNDYPHQFSGGMRQRVMIAMALAASPKILLADEPTTALDVTIQAQILDLLAELQEQQDLSIIMITHDLGVVAGFCDRVLVMYAGHIVERGLTGPLFEQPLHPYTEGLLASVPRLEHSAQELVGIPGHPPSLLHPPTGCSFAARCPYVADKCKETLPSQEELDGRFVACYHHALERKGA